MCILTLAGAEEGRARPGQAWARLTGQAGSRLRSLTSRVSLDRRMSIVTVITVLIAPSPFIRRQPSPPRSL